MAQTERGPSAPGPSDIIDEEAVGELLSNIPAHGTDEPATKDFVRAEVNAASNRIIIWAVGANTAMVGLVLTVTSLR